MAKFATNASGAIWWPKLEPMLVALHVGQISFSQDYFKLLSVGKLIQVEMLYPGSVVPLAMFWKLFGIFRYFFIGAVSDQFRNFSQLLELLTSQ